ncbi:MAG: TIGR04282 family arsenosugar biosynthesis glycosyltransferase [Pyrinomonadaceae bacterium]
MSHSPTPKTKCALGLMAKAPLAGEVKTRLVPPLTPAEAAALNVCFLRDMAANIAELTAAGRADGLVVYAPAGAEAAFDGILPEGFRLLLQRGESLGDRLCNATEDLLQNGYSSVCLINSDSPTLPRSVIDRAIESLAIDGDRVVLGAADDGGYYLIGLRQAHQNLFHRIAWSTADVLAHTIERAAETGLPVELLPRWYDVDDAETLNRLCEELFAPHRRDGAYPAPHTRNFLASLIEKEGSQRIYPKLSQRMTT